MGVSKVRAGIISYLTPSQPLIEGQLAPLRDAATECLDKQELRLVLDLSGVAFADSKGLELLLEIQRDVQNRGGSLKLANPNQLINEILALTRLDRQFETYFDLKRAGRSFL